MPQIRSLRAYLKSHPHYIGTFLKDACQVWWWRLLRQPIVVLTTESGGLGDYLWFRSYYNAIREHYAPKRCRIIVIGMCQWHQLAYDWDAYPQSNHFDIYREFESPDNPHAIESMFFRLFRVDIYVNYRACYLKDMVKAPKTYFGLGFRREKQYYEAANNAVMGQWFRLPIGFKHRPPLLPIVDNSRLEELRGPYVVVVEGGNTQGKLSIEQTLAIVEYIQSHGFNIFFNGDYQKLIAALGSQLATGSSRVIDGYQYPLAEYPTIVSNSIYVVTVNTFVYHLAIQLSKPVVVISANEYESIKLDEPRQVIVFNKELRQAYENNTLQSYQPIPSVTLRSIECNEIVVAIKSLNRH